MFKLTKILLLTAVVSSVAACSVSTPSAKVPVSLPPLPVELTCSASGKDANGKPCVPACPYAVLIPDRDIDQAETEKFWRQDRTHLIACRKSKDAIIHYYEALRANLAAGATGK
jgi:hypothetical protein